MDNNEKDWISDIVEKTVERYNSRLVILWGYYEISHLIRKRLKEEYNIDVEFFVDGDSSKIDGDMILPVSSLRGKNREYFIIIPIAYYQSIKNILIEYGYTPDDYYYFCDCIVTKTENYYEDTHGNKIIGNYRDAKIVLSGFNSVVTIGKGFTAQIGTVVYIHSNARVLFGDNCRINGSYYIGEGSTITIGNNFINHNYTIVYIDSDAELIIGDKFESLADFNMKTAINLFSRAKVEFGNNLRVNGIFTVNSDAFLKIGNDLSVNRNFQIDVCSYTELIIGHDCMFSHDLTFYTNDAHSIFDIETGENINSTQAISSQKKIIIGNHVWIGAGSIILYNTRIGDGSIIGAGSIVKSIIPNNCIAAGTPAKIVRRNIAWCRNNGSENITDCGEGYINMTIES